MTSPPEKIKIKCPKCGTIYDDWYRPSINLTLDNFDEDYIEDASTSVCPNCKYVVLHNVLTVREDGKWVLGGENFIENDSSDENT